MRLSPDEVVVFRATQNDWDAPLAHYGHADGSATLRRDDQPPGAPWVSCTYLPHAVVLVRGELSPFDAERQP